MNLDLYVVLGFTVSIYRWAFLQNADSIVVDKGFLLPFNPTYVLRTVKRQHVLD